MNCCQICKKGSHQEEDLVMAVVAVASRMGEVVGFLLVVGEEVEDHFLEVVAIETADGEHFPKATTY